MKEAAWGTSTGHENCDKVLRRNKGTKSQISITTMRIEPNPEPNWTTNQDLQTLNLLELLWTNFQQLTHLSKIWISLKMQLKKIGRCFGLFISRFCSLRLNSQSFTFLHKVSMKSWTLSGNIRKTLFHILIVSLEYWQMEAAVENEERIKHEVNR